jgi:hypothetical protein
MNVFALSNTKRRALGLIAAAALSLTMIAPALADPVTVTTTVPTGTLSATLGGTALTGASYPAGSASSATLSTTLTVDDPTGGANGTNTGWNVTLEQTGDFSCTNCDYLGSGSDTFITIAKTNMALTTAGSIALVAGQDIDATNGPELPAGLSTPTGLGGGSAVKVITAEDDYGNGRYTEALGFTLTIPQFTRPGAYSGTLTLTLSAAP